MLAIWGKAKREGKKPAAEKMRATVVDVSQKITGIEGCLGFGSPEANLEHIHTYR